jgi:hypothetical protein
MDGYAVSLTYKKFALNSPEAKEAYRQLRQNPKHWKIVNQTFKTKRQAEAARKRLPTPGLFYVSEVLSVLW